MRNQRSVLVVIGTLILATSTACGTSSGDSAPPTSTCPTPTTDDTGDTVYLADDVDGVDARDCDLVGAVVDFGGGAVTVPEPGRGVGFAADGTDSSSEGQLDIAPDGTITITR